MSTMKFGRYGIKSELGRGGMATVFHAYDPSFERDVAIKVLPPGFLHDPQLRTRFEREAKMIASLEHPSIVPVYDFGDEEGQPYIVMRYMSGGSLAERLAQGALSLEETARIISRLAQALDAAHARGIIHRDLKPGNVLFDQYGNAFLSDFGIARISQQEGATLTGSAIVGTPTYMSPEQVQGDKTIDQRSDIYALGVMVYQMLIGKAPYHADTPAKVMLMHLLEPVPHILDTKADLPEGCDRIIRRAMAKDPDDRYATSGELSRDLENISRNIPAKPAPEKPALDATLVASATIAATPPPVSRAQPAVETVVARPKPAPQPVAEPVKKRSPLLVIGIIVGVLLAAGILLGSGAYLLGQRGIGPLAVAAVASPTATLAPEATATEQILPPTTAAIAVVETPATEATSTPSPTTVAPTETPAASSTPTELPKGPVIGGADKIAFLKDNDLWVANLDGTDLRQLTRDGTTKSSLAWTPDGQAITFITAKCIQIARLEEETVEDLACFNYVDSIKQFEPSRDGLSAAITLDNQLYLVPYDLERLKQVNTRGDIAEMADCKEFAPYLKNFITMVRWSADSQTIAAKLIANLGNGIQGDIIQLFRIDQCIPNPRAIDNFPPPRFEMEDYSENPVIQNFDWDGGALFALNSFERNDGFGHLYVYHSELKKAYPRVNPIDNQCCYRDPQFSPDGSHLLFAYQNTTGGVSGPTQLYLVEYASIGSGATYTPLPLPEINNPKEKPQPILRPAR